MQEESTLSPIQLFFRNKWVRLFLIIDLLLIIILIIILIWQSTKVSTISFNITPLDSNISINGKHFENGQSSITPGEYQVTITHDGLVPKSFILSIAPQEVTTITAFLTDANSSFDYYKQRSNYMSYKKLEEIASVNNNITTDHDTSAESFIQKFQENYHAFTNILPINYNESEGYGQTLKILKTISIVAKYDCELTLCAKAQVVGTNSQEFIRSLMQNKGINVEDFEIEYKFY